MAEGAIEEMPTMPAFDANRRSEIGRYISDLHNEVIRTENTIKEKFPFYARPRELERFFGRLKGAQRELQDAVGSIAIELTGAWDDVYRLAIVEKRRRVATSIEQPMQMTFHPDLRKTLQENLKPLDQMIHQTWVTRAPLLRMPTLADFLTLEQAEALLDRDIPSQPARIYDEKFHILQAPALAMMDLAYYRRKCAFRDLSVTFAYLDIDDFKQFNTEYGETRIDLEVLPIFMKALEAFVFARGYAYRYGGDEYALLLPNLDKKHAVVQLDELRVRVCNLTYAGVQLKTRISIGCCTVDSQCHLTDREIEERASRAKKHAKDSGKDCVATYEGDLFRDEELYVAAPIDPGADS